MKEFTLLFPAKVFFGFGSMEKLAFAAIKGKTGVIVTGRGSAKKSGALEKLRNILGKAGKKVFVFDRVEPEVPVETVDLCAEFCRKKGADFIIGLGGGSAIDCAKAAAGIYKDKRSVKDYLDKKATVKEDTGFFIAIPTTSGSGSEATKNAVLTYTEKRIKISLRGEALVPSIAVVDPSLTMKMGKELTAWTGMDAMTHAVESYFSRNANEATKPFSFRAITLLAGNILRAYRNPGDRKARYNMMLGSFLAGIAFANAGLGAVHGIGHPLGAVCRLPHGLVNSMLLPRVLEFNSGAIAGGLKGFEKSAGYSLINKVKALNKAMSVPEKFSAICPGIKNSLEDIIKRVEYSASMAYNPVKMDEKKVRQVLKGVV